MRKYYLPFVNPYQDGLVREVAHVCKHGFAARDAQHAAPKREPGSFAAGLEVPHSIARRDSLQSKVACSFGYMQGTCNVLQASVIHRKCMPLVYIRCSCCLICSIAAYTEAITRSCAALQHAETVGSTKATRHGVWSGLVNR